MIYATPLIFNPYHSPNCQCVTPAQLCERIRTLVADGYTATEMAAQLNQEAFHPPRQDHCFTPAGVLNLMRRLGLYQRRPKGVKTEILAEDEWWLPDLARALELPNSTLYNWVKRGDLRYRKQTSSPYRLIIWADEAEIQQLKQRHQIPYSERMRQQWLAKEEGSSAHSSNSSSSTSGE